MNAIRRRIFLLLVFSITLFLFIFYNAFYTSSKSSVFNETHQQQSQNKTGITRKKREPIIFSKAEYLKQTRNVILFSCLPSFSYY
jgi:hypothetical protein